jgi:hypothetical protein
MNKYLRRGSTGKLLSATFLFGALILGGCGGDGDGSGENPNHFDTNKPLFAYHLDKRLMGDNEGVAWVESLRECEPHWNIVIMQPTGKVEDNYPDSTWITCEPSRADVFREDGTHFELRRRENPNPQDTWYRISNWNYDSTSIEEKIVEYWTIIDNYEFYSHRIVDGKIYAYKVEEYGKREALAIESPRDYRNGVSPCLGEWDEFWRCLFTPIYINLYGGYYVFMYQESGRTAPEAIDFSNSDKTFELFYYSNGIRSGRFLYERITGIEYVDTVLGWRELYPGDR